MSLFVEIEHLHSLMTHSELPETSAGSIWNSGDFDQTLSCSSQCNCRINSANLIKSSSPSISNPVPNLLNDQNILWNGSNSGTNSQKE